MAYRQLFAIACFACGLATAGCGSGGNGSAAGTDSTNDSPTSSSDQAPVSHDQAPVSRDQAPVSQDQAPSASPGGRPSGGAAAACNAFCAQFGGADGCMGDNGANGLVRSICNSGCVLDAEDEPCQPEVVSALDCLSHLAGLCTPNGPSEADASVCQAVLETVSTCEDAHKPPDMQMDKCTMVNGCDCGNDDCKSCRCLLGEMSETCTAICN